MCARAVQANVSHANALLAKDEATIGNVVGPRDGLLKLLGNFNHRAALAEKTPFSLTH